MTQAQAPVDRVDGTLLRLVGVMVLGGMLSFLDATIVNTGIHTLTDAFQASLGSIEWVATGYLLAAALAIPIAGWAVDRFGAKRMWLLGLSVLLVSSILCSIAWDPGSLIFFRVIQGFGGGMVDPIMMTVVATAAGPNRMGRVMGLISVPITLGPVVGPILGGLLLGSLSWQWMFLINVPIAALALIFALKVIPADAPRTGTPARLDLLGALLLCPGFAAVVYALSQAGGAGFGAPRVLTALLIGIALFIAYVVHALRPSTQALIDLRLFANRAFTAAVGIMFLVGGVLYSMLFLLPLFYQQVRVHDVLTAGLLVMPLAIGMPFLAPLAGKFADKIGAKLLVPVGGALIAIGTLIYTQSGADSPQALLTVGQIITGCGLAVVGSPTMGSIYRSVQPEKIPTATGAVFILNLIGASLGIAIAALLLQSGEPGRPVDDVYAGAFWWPAIAGGLILLLGLLLPGRPTPQPAAAPADGADTTAVKDPA